MKREKTGASIEKLRPSVFSYELALFPFLSPFLLVDAHLCEHEGVVEGYVSEGVVAA